MFDNVRAMPSMAQGLVFRFKRIALRYPCVTNSESDRDGFLLTVDDLEQEAQK